MEPLKNDEAYGRRFFYAESSSNLRLFVYLGGPKGIGVAKKGECRMDLQQDTVEVKVPSSLMTGGPTNMEKTTDTAVRVQSLCACASVTAL